MASGEDTAVTQKDIAPMLRRVSKDAGPGLWGWTPVGASENRGDEPARALVMNTDGTPKLITDEH